MGKCFHLCCCCTEWWTWGSQSLLPLLPLPLPLWFLRAAWTNVLDFILEISAVRHHCWSADSQRADVTLCVQNLQVPGVFGSQPTAGETGGSDNKPVPSSTRDWLNWICNLCAATSSSPAWLAVTVTRRLFICAVVRFFSSLHTFFLKSIFIERTARLISPLYTLPPAWLPSASGRRGKCQAWSCRRAAEVLICLNSKNWITLTYALQWPQGGAAETACERVYRKKIDRFYL